MHGNFQDYHFSVNDDDGYILLKIEKKEEKKNRIYL